MPGTEQVGQASSPSRAGAPVAAAAAASDDNGAAKLACLQRQTLCYHLLVRLCFDACVACICKAATHNPSKPEVVLVGAAGEEGAR
jgi:hypothetical protein